MVGNIAISNNKKKTLSKIKYNKRNTTITKRKQKNKKWYDKDCIAQKSKTKKLANQKHINPLNPQILDEHRASLKNYKHLCMQ